MQQGLSNDPDKSDHLGVLIPAHNEESVIAACLSSLLEVSSALPKLQVVVAANGCTDDTVSIARSFAADFVSKGWSLEVLDLKSPGKIAAINTADAQISCGSRVFLDADVLVDPELLGQLAQALSDPEPVYASGTMQVVRPKSWVSRLYLTAWQKTGFMNAPAQGAGLFAVNAAGRKKWQQLPDVISDDTYIRTLFKPSERKEVAARFYWPLPEGFGNLVRARRRQDAGMRQLHQLYRDQMTNEAKPRNRVWGSAFTHPAGFLVYVAVRVVARLKRNTDTWARGR